MAIFGFVSAFFFIISIIMFISGFCCLFIQKIFLFFAKIFGFRISEGELLRIEQTTNNFGFIKNSYVVSYDEKDGVSQITNLDHIGFLNGALGEVKKCNEGMKFPLVINKNGEIFSGLVSDVARWISYFVGGVLLFVSTVFFMPIITFIIMNFFMNFR